MSKLVSISKERYEELLECEKFRDKRRFDGEFVKEIREGERLAREGRARQFDSWEEMEKRLDSL